MDKKKQCTHSICTGRGKGLCNECDGEEYFEVIDGGEFNAITGPDHYLKGRQYEPRKVIDDWGLGFYLGNTVKYISRAGRKGSRLEDLKKARQYLDWEIEKEENK